MQGYHPEFIPTYTFVNKELEILAADLQDLATQTDQQITLEEAEAAHLHLNQILRQFILAARVAGFKTPDHVPSTPPT